MKIGIVCPYDLFRPGGVQEHVLAEHRVFTARGHDVRIITPRPRLYEDEPPKEWIFLGKSTKMKTPQDTSLEVSAAVDLEAIDDIFSTENFDVVQFHEPLVPVLSRQLLGRCTALKVGTFHAAMPDTVMGKSIAGTITPYIKSVLKQLDVITAVSPAATTYISDYADKKIHFIPNGIDLESYTQQDKQRDPNMILYVGRLEKRKGVLHLINAFIVLQKSNPEARLVIAGNGPEKRKLQNVVAEKELRRVEFLGFIDDDKKRELMATCSIFVAPAIHGESFGIVLLEAMAMGAPTVAGDNAGYAYLMRDRGLSSLINPKDTIDFARRMRFFMTDQEFRKLWLKWSDEYIEQYSYKHIIDAYENLFSQQTFEY